MCDYYDHPDHRGADLPSQCRHLNPNHRPGDTVMIRTSVDTAALDAFIAAARTDMEIIDAFRGASAAEIDDIHAEFDATVAALDRDPINAARRLRAALGQYEADPDKPCRHDDCDSHIAIAVIVEDDDPTTVCAYSANIRVVCNLCGEPFVWIGVNPGLSPREPRMSVDGLKLIAPLRPKTSPEDFGLDGPAVDVRRIV